jgi:F-type H+-transporting ATPase subunit c
LKGNSKITPIQPHSVAQNPSLAKQLFGYAILGFALTETIVLFALMMAFKNIYIYF